MIRVNKLVLSASFALLASVASAHADTAEERSVIVSTKGLDLSDPAHVERLYGRIRAAVREVCEPLESRSAATQAAWNACREGALSRAVAAVGNDALLQRHLAKRGGAQPKAS